MAILPYPTGGLILKTVSGLPAKARNGQVVLNGGDGNYYVWLFGTWNLIMPPAFTNDTGVPIGLLIGLTYP